jgi:RES domain-containing protein
VSIQAYFQSWEGEAVRHIPKLAQYDIYDFSYAGRSAENRWNVRGEPTLYLAKGKNFALGEYARQIQERAVYRFGVRLERVVNLCNLEVWRELSLTNAPDCFKNRDVARACANFIRHTTTATAMFVPSMAFLDDLEQWCLMLFLEKLPADVREFLPNVTIDGTFRIE